MEMMMLIFSDLHANRTAFVAAINKLPVTPSITACILLGDLIDYGPHSNEVIQMVKELPYPVLCSLRGNHEDAGYIRPFFIRARQGECTLHKEYSKRCLLEVPHSRDGELREKGI